MACEDRILEVHGVSKKFSHTIPAKRRQVLRQFAKAIISGQADDSEKLAKDEFWALHDVSFTVNRGEALGLIGLNGAGKSTLLSIIARQLLPDRGMVRSKGIIVAMINLTAGFEHSLTGRENVFLKGALMGWPKAQIQEQFEEIVDFAEIGEFIDSPVSTYSSGMRMRLAFSLAVHQEPDLLLIDEVLSVGDFRFRQKCLRKLNELRRHASFVFVSHSLEELGRFCSRLVVLDKGQVGFVGDIRSGLEFYAAGQAEYGSAEVGEADASISSVTARAPLSVMGAFLHREDVIGVVSFSWEAENGGANHIVSGNNPVTAKIILQMKSSSQGLVVGLPIWNDDAVLVTGISSANANVQLHQDSKGRVSVQLKFRSFSLNPGAYYPVLTVMRNSEIIYRKAVAPLVVEDAGVGVWGVFTPDVEWECLSDPG